MEITMRNLQSICGTYSHTITTHSKSKKAHRERERARDELVVLYTCGCNMQCGWCFCTVQQTAATPSVASVSGKAAHTIVPAQRISAQHSTAQNREIYTCSMANIVSELKIYLFLFSSSFVVVAFPTLNIGCKTPFVYLCFNSFGIFIRIDWLTAAYQPGVHHWHGICKMIKNEANTMTI